MRTVGVVIPTYNRAQYVPETLDAILSQTRPAQQIVVVDDGSTDNTQEVIRDYGARITSVRVLNGGELRARNLGIAQLKTELVAFCDSDDLWEPDFIEAMARQWDYTPDLQVCYANFRIREGSEVRATTKFDGAPTGFWSGADQKVVGCGVFDMPLIKHLIEFQPFFPSCMMADREKFISHGGWDEAVSRIIGCDLATVMKVAVRPPVGFVVKPLVQIRKHDGNFSADTEKMNLGDALVLEHVLKAVPEVTEFEDIIKRSISKRRADAIDSAFARKAFRTYRQILCWLTCRISRTKTSDKAYYCCCWLASMPNSIAIDPNADSFFLCRTSIL